MDHLVEAIKENLERVFRNVLPGMLILGTARASHRSWFNGIDKSDPWNLLFIFAVGLVVGNAWYSFHRLCVNELIVFILFRWRLNGPARLGVGASYCERRADFILKRHRAAANAPNIREELRLQHSQIHFMYICSEAAIAFSFRAECGTFFANHHTIIFLAGVIAFALTVGVEILASGLDYAFVSNYQETSARSLQ